MAEPVLKPRVKPARKGRTVHVRVTDDEHAAISGAAEATGMTISAFYRSLLLEGAGVQPMLTEDDRTILAVLREDMRMIGVNLNQVARALNSGRAVHAGEITISIENVQRVQAAVMSELRQFASRQGQRRRAAG